MTDDKMKDIFQFYIENLELAEGKVEKSEFKNINFDPTKATGRFVQGYASTPAWDSDGESIVKSGLDVDYYNKQGWLNWMHKNEPSHIIGIPVYSKIDHVGFFTKGMLLSNDMATHVWNLGKELEQLGYPRKLGFSIEGKVVQRSSINKSKIVKAKVTNVAVTHIPVNIEATFEVVSKSFVPSTYDEIVSYIMKDLDLQKNLAALDSGGGAQTANAPIKGGDTGEKVLQTESLEGSGGNPKEHGVLVGNPSDKELGERLTSAYRTAYKSGSSDLATFMRMVHPEASDSLLKSLVELIYLADGPDNFVKIIEESNILE
jgi:hypothetical protein